MNPRDTKGAKSTATANRRRAKKPVYEFDAALSFAGEDRRHASKLARALTAKGYKVFYDRDFCGQLWGKGQHEYEQIYGPRSRFVIPFVSENYTRKEWTRFEFESAKREARNRDGDFLLPVRIDNARLFGLTDDVNYLRLGDLRIGEIVAEFARKCGPPPGSRETLSHTRKTRVASKAVARLLSSDTRFALGLFVTAVLPLPITNYKKLFPTVRWRVHSRRLAAAGLIRIVKNRVVVSNIARACFVEKSEKADLHQHWIRALSQIPPHVDTTLVLAVHYLETRSFEDVANTIAEAAETTNLGDWNHIYLSVLRPLVKKAAKHHLTASSRWRLYNALGICLSNAGQHSEALTWFRKVSVSPDREGWRGQALLNLGVSYGNLGTIQKAAHYYRQAIQYGRKRRDDILVARAKGNLGQLIKSISPSEAAELLSESIRLKKKHKDEPGLAIAYGQLGQMKVVLGQTQAAIRYFTAARDKAEGLGMREALALALHDLGTISSSCGRRSAALKYYRQAFRIASEDGYGENQILTASSLGRLYFDLKRFHEALDLFRGLTTVAERRGDHLGVICGHHAIGMILRLQGKEEAGRDHIHKALRLARKERDGAWTARSLIDMCRQCKRKEFSGFDLRALRRAAIGEERRQSWSSAARLWEVYADVIRDSGPAQRTHRAFVRAIECSAKLSSEWKRRSDILSRHYSWLWQAGEQVRAVKVLRTLAGVARAAKRADLEARAIDQRGVCLQHMRKFLQAKADHLRALQIARRSNDQEQIARSLNNLGEVLRKLGEYKPAIQALVKAQEIALVRRDFEGALSAAENRVLVLWQHGNYHPVAQLLAWCRRVAINRRLWDQAVTALARLAELAWEQKDTKKAKRLFGVAIAQVKRHTGCVCGHRIALNYSRLLLSEGEVGRAARVLLDWSSVFAKEPDAYLFHYTTAEIYYENGDFHHAEDHWRLGLASAKTAGNRDYVAMCSSRLAEVLEIRRKLSASEEQLQVALENESEPTGRALLLIQMLRVQLANGSQRRAERTFIDVRKLAVENKLHTVTIDIHVMIGDYYWVRAGESVKLNALKAYIVAMLTALQVGIDAYSGVVTHFVTFATRPKSAPSERLFETLVKRLDGWVDKEITRDPRNKEIVMSPILALRRLLPLTKDRVKLAEELKRMARSGQWFASAKQSEREATA